MCVKLAYRTAYVFLTGGTGVIGRGVGLVGKGMATLGEAAAVGKVASTGEKLKKIYEASKMIKTGAKLSDDVAGAAKTARALNAAKHLEVGAMMSLAESSVEAREKSKELSDSEDEGTQPSQAKRNRSNSGSSSSSRSWTPPPGTSKECTWPSAVMLGPIGTKPIDIPL